MLFIAVADKKTSTKLRLDNMSLTQTIMTELCQIVNFEKYTDYNIPETRPCW